ncbi:hypothetical protein BV22DRAFT_1123808 [Leucogyrophana mollusca]|uniref:Uncharacterized protein n=1 Tax=Leucogyrophana mollusca TaxID=85980 RepID=A0ACB8AY39_9AGAM|nr:hypothetical protein BV22DRAFT_1123808 [Leucogyrophana mollusca]
MWAKARSAFRPRCAVLTCGGNEAKIEKFLEPDVLAGAEGDLTITVVPPLDLSATNCPPVFLPFLRVWSAAVPRIQDLAPQHQHDLARIICGLALISEGRCEGTSLRGIAADLRAIAIEISQCRSFQNRYAANLQAALDARGDGPSLKVKASLEPPPLYDDSRLPSSLSSSFERTPSPSTLIGLNPDFSATEPRAQPSRSNNPDRSFTIPRGLK